MGKTEVIETGVDKLVELIKRQKRISIREAAVKLGVSASLVEEWANFLEEEGLIAIDYKVTTPYLVDKVLDKEQVEQKKQAFYAEKDILLRKAEHTLDFLNDQGQEIKTIREEFLRFKKDMGKEVTAAKEVLKELEETLTDVRAKEKEIEAEVLRGEEATKRFQDIISKKDSIEELVKKIDADREALRQDVLRLIGTVKALSLSMDARESQGHIDELQEKFAAVHEQRSSIEEELRKLSHMIKGVQ